MKEYERLTVKKVERSFETYIRVDKDYILSAYDIIDEEKQDLVEMLLNRLAELEDKIENGTLIFKEKPKTKYYAIVGYRNCYGKFGWHIHYVSIEYEKEHNRVALNIDGRLFVTTKDLLFTTKAEAEKKLKELNGGIKE